MINFISNLAPLERSGGGTARNAAAYAALSRRLDVNYVGPVNPPVRLAQKAVSKMLRLAGGQGDFFFFSPKRLAAIADEVASRCRGDAALDFFNGFTPWIACRPARPFIAWNDCTFHDYMTIFHRRQLFRDADLKRIEQAEANWLKQARLVIFRSRWFAERAIAHYGLAAGRVRSVGNFGEVEPPEKDSYAGASQFAFVSTQFEAKGGPMVLAALGLVQKTHPQASLVIVGDRPRQGGSLPGVEYAGYLRKDIPVEAERFRHILAQARALVHPTKSDTNPAILVEAGYFGCPAITSRKFAIPEVVEDGRNGLLLEEPLTVDALAGAMRRMLENGEAYPAMRLAAWQSARENHSKARFEESLLACVREALPGGGMS